MMRAKEMLVSKKLKEPGLQGRQAKEGMRMKVQLGERMILGLLLLSLAFPVSPALGKEFPFPNGSFEHLWGGKVPILWWGNYKPVKGEAPDGKVYVEIGHIESGEFAKVEPPISPGEKINIKFYAKWVEGDSKLYLKFGIRERKGKKKVTPFGGWNIGEVTVPKDGQWHEITHQVEIPKYYPENEYLTFNCKVKNGKILVDDFRFEFVTPLVKASKKPHLYLKFLPEESGLTIYDLEVSINGKKVMDIEKFGKEPYLARAVWTNSYQGYRIDDKKWHYIAVSYSTKTKIGYIFIDGEMRAKTQRNWNVLDKPGKKANLIIGRGNIGFAGLISNVRIYNEQLPIETLKEHYRREKVRYLEGKEVKEEKLPPSLVGWWKLDEGEGEVVKDSSGRGNDGILRGALWVKGKFGTCLFFNGNSCVVVKNPDLDIESEFTIELWTQDVKTDCWTWSGWIGYHTFQLFGDAFPRVNLWVNHDRRRDVAVGYDASSYRSISRRGVLIYAIPLKEKQGKINIRAKVCSRGKPFQILLSLDPQFKETYSVPVEPERGFTYIEEEIDYDFPFLTSGIFADTQRRKSRVEWMWGVGELWWYNACEVFYYNCEVDFRKEDSTIFWVEGKGEGGLFGVRFPCWTELKKGWEYRFSIACFPEPDFILFDNKIVWKKGEGKYEDQYVRFSYFPIKKKEVPEIYIVKKSTSVLQRITFSRVPYYSDKLVCQRVVAYMPSVPKYEEFNLPSSTLYISITPEISYSFLEKYSRHPIDYKPLALPEVDYPKDKVKILETCIPVDSPLSAHFKKIGIDAVGVRKGDLEVFIKKVKNLGIKSFVIAPVMPPPITKGKHYHYSHWIDLITGFGQRWWKKEENLSKVEEGKKLTIEVIKKLTSEFPEGKVYLFCPEFNSIYGMWGGGITYSPMRQLSPEWEEIIKKGGVRAFKAIFDYFNSIHQEIKEAVGKDKVKIVFQLDRAGCQGAYAVKCGADIIMHKNIHRQNLNIVVANSRGSAFAYDKEYGFDHDCWDRCYLHDYHPDEVKQDLLVYFHSGGQYILPEIPIVAKGGKNLSRLGKEWFDFIRYCKLHPERGRQKVRIGIMRGLPDEWNRVGGPASMWETAKDAKEVTFHPYFTDYNLLNIVFANFGTCYRTYPDRLCTGTPYGPVDFIPWDTPEDKLKNYGVIIYLGKSTCMDEFQYENLKEYVKGGGTLIMAVGQLRKEDGEFYKEDLTDLFGVKIKGKFTLKADPIWDRERQTWIFPEGKKEYTQLEVTGEEARVFYRLKNSDPYVVKNRLGKGKTYLFCTEYLTEFGEETPTRVILPELEEVKWLEFSPESSWIEYMVQKKGDIYILPIFNHGNVGYPSGNGRKTGAWEGKITLNLKKFDLPKGRLSVYRVIYQPDKKMPFTLKKIKSIQKEGTLSFNILIDKFVEVVIGPSRKVKKEYFYGEV